MGSSPADHWLDYRDRQIEADHAERKLKHAMRALEAIAKQRDPLSAVIAERALKKIKGVGQ